MLKVNMSYLSPKGLIYVLVVFLLGLLLNCSDSNSDKADIAYLLPVDNEANNWRLNRASQKAIGGDLFTLINGGADIYIEYGFKEALFQEYKNDTDKSIIIEIYKMESSESAFGIYTFKTSGAGKKYHIGNEASLESYYMNFWKGDFLVTLIGFDSGEATIQGIIALAKVVDSKIKSPGQKPELVDLLPIENLDNLTVKYLRGNLAVLNNDVLKTQNIFRVREGVIGNYGSYKVLIFKYDSRIESKKWFNLGMKHLKNDSLYKTVMSQDNWISFVDKNGVEFVIEQTMNFILIVFNTTSIDEKKVLNHIRDNINSISNKISH